MPNIQVISHARHTTMRWKRFTSYDFAAKDACAALVVQELAHAMLHVPIAFLASADAYVPVAVQGLALGQNLFVNHDGRWLGSYVPMVYRCHPFAYAETTPGQQVLCFDEDSGLLSPTEGESFFDADGKPSTAVSEVMGFLGQMTAGRQQTQRICALLQKHNLFEPWPIKIVGEHGEQALAGLYRINEAAMNKLPADAFIELRDAGALVCVYCQLLSAPHLQTLGKLSEFHTKAGNAAPARVPTKGKELDLSFLEGRETLRFS